jgi:ectoine hydroxylase-related dioxygenase (phytanoyl-CoA dioxygenase family)
MPHSRQEAIDEPFELREDAPAYFDEHGFVHLDGVFDAPTLHAYEPEITTRVIELNTMHLPMEQRSTYDKAFLQVTNLWRHSSLVKEFVFGKRLARIAAQLLGVAGVRLYHDQALYKEAGGGITPWHADEYYWPLSSDRTCTAWVPLQETPLEMGPLGFADGSHRFEFGRDLPISDESEARLQEELSEREFPLVMGPYRLGDVSFHRGWTFHRASGNATSVPRRVMTIIYMDADIRVAEPTNDFQRNDWRDWLGGVAVGSVASGPLNPVLC